jgi:uncharacterized protein
VSEERTHEYTHGLHGLITLTELSSDDPAATRDWCAGVLGWGFQPVFASPAGGLPPVRLLGARRWRDPTAAPGEAAACTPTVHVDDTDQAYQTALAARAGSVA